MGIEMRASPTEKGASVNYCLPLGSRTKPGHLRVDEKSWEVQPPGEREGAPPVRGKGRAHPQLKSERANILSA